DAAAGATGTWPWWPPVVPTGGAYCSWTNQGTATVTDANGISYLVAPTSVTNVRLRRKAQPGTPFTITALMYRDHTTAANSEMGLILRDSATDKMVSLCMRDRDQLSVQRYTNVTTVGATVANASTLARISLQDLLWLQMAHDGTNLSFSFAFDGRNFTLLNSHVKTASFTTDSDQVGYFVCNRNSGVTIAMSMVHWAQS